ncbi:recombinase family protein, partial [Clostridium perfringens]|nr:recombinase family protein [Clostridium perfringens]
EEQIKIAFNQAEKEVEDLRQRTREGLVTAKIEGKKVGREKGDKLTTKKSVESKKLIRKYSKEFEGSLTDKDCIKLIGISRNSYYKYKREMLEE